MIVHELRDDSLPPAELTELARTTFRLLRLAALGQLVVANAERIARWLDDVHEAYGYDDHRALLEYIYAAGSDEGMIEAIIEHTREDLKDTVMSIADKLEARGWAKGEAKGRAEGEAKGRAEGEAKGRAEGEARGRATLLLRQLERRFGSLPPLVATSVLAATPEQVEAWALRLLDASTLDELLRDA
jgi:hypothetical protein